MSVKNVVADEAAPVTEETVVDVTEPIEIGTSIYIYIFSIYHFPTLLL